MTTRFDDELVVPQFRDELWRELAELHAAPGDRDEGDAARLGPQVDTRRAGRADRVRPARAGSRRRLIVAAAVVALGAAAGVVLAGGRDEPRTVTAPADRATTTATAAEVPRPLGIVVTEARNAEGIVVRSWKDERTGLWRDLAIGADGLPRSDSGAYTRAQVGDEVVISTRQVDHCFREYEDTELRMPIETARQAMPEDQRAGEIPDTVFEDGTLVAEGTEVVDGRELLRYRDDANDGVVWLDPETRELVKRRYAPGSDAEQATTYEYLAPTPENLAQLVPVVPPGYTTPRSDRTDEDRVAAGCD